MKQDENKEELWRLSLSRQKIQFVSCSRLSEIIAEKKRLIDVSPKMTYEELDHKIRVAFDYDTDDHCSAFFAGPVWQGESLAEVYPDGEGENQNKTIRKLLAKAGATLSYVYDFGDDVQHSISFEETSQTAR